jgi:SAM-dependent methyltransferase
MEANDEARAAWDGPIFEKFARFRAVMDDGLGQFGVALLDRYPVGASDRVLDIGVGFGDSSAAIASRTSGEVLGVDIAPRFIEHARKEFGGRKNLRYEAADVQLDPLGGPYDRAFARFGTMFFASPVAALRNVHRALKKGALFTFVVWRKREDNPWVHHAEKVARELIVMPEEKSGPTCGPGPFSMQSPDLVSDQLVAAGFHRISFERLDTPILIGRTVDEAIDFALALGPAGEIMRLGQDAESKRPALMAALRRTFEGMAGEGGVHAGSSAWLISARA